MPQDVDCQNQNIKPKNGRQCYLKDKNKKSKARKNRKER